MTPETLDNIVTILLALIGPLVGGVVGARLTKTSVELNYKQLFEDATLKANRLSDKVDKLAHDALATAEREAKNVLALAALQAKFELVEGQRVEQEKRHALEMSMLNAKIAVLQAENSTVKTDLSAAMSKLAKTEQWVDVLQTRLNPPPLSAADTQAIQTLRDKPPASDKTPGAPGSEAV